MEFELSYQLSGRGWSRLLICGGEQRCELIISYISSPFEDLCHFALEAIGDPTYARQEQIARWEGEPELWEVAVLPVNEDRLRLRVLHSTGYGPLPPQTIFDQLVPRYGFAYAVLRSGEGMLALAGEDGYEAEWARPFPTRTFRRLQHALRNK